MAPHMSTTDPVAAPVLQSMTENDYLSLCLRILSRCQPQKIPNNHHHHHDACRANKPQFKCSICGKSFPSYHALGGHKSSHRRPADPAQQIKPAIVDVNVEDEGLPHKCNVCYKSFATGQALGGHKRCHYLDGYLTSGSAAYSASTLSSVRDFDLNLPPKNEPGVNVWGEEDEVSSPLPAKKHRRLV